MTTFQVLGAFAAETGGVPVELGGPRQQAVLARLLVARGRVVSADRVVEDLWPEAAPPRALTGLQAYVSHLRRALEPGRAPRTPARLLVTVPPGYAVLAGAEDVDAWRFEAAVVRAGELLAAGHAAAARDALAVAEALWRGPAYGLFADLPWAVEEAARLAEIRATAAERGADAAIRLGATAEAAAGLTAHTRAHPLREEGWRLLALALYREGRQGEALAALRRARAHLADELGVDPGPALRRLESDVLAHAPHLAPTPAGPTPGPTPEHALDPHPGHPPAPHPNETAPTPTTPGRPGPAAHPDRNGAAPRASVDAPAPGRTHTAAAPHAPPTRSPGPTTPTSPTRTPHPPLPALHTSRPHPPHQVDLFVGRGAECARVSAAAEVVAGGRFGVVLVSGDAGVGKTALAGRIRERLVARGWTCVVGRCPETEGAPGGWAWAEALRALLTSDGNGRNGTAGEPPIPRPEALAPLLDNTSAADAGQSFGALAAARFRSHQAAGELLDRAAATRPVLVVLDDLHRADDETLALLAHLPRQRPDARVLVLGTYRHTEDATPFADTRAQIAAHVLDRIRLDGLAEADIATLVRATCTRPVDGATVAAIADRTAGNPLFARETARLLEAEGELVAVSEVPAGVADVLRRRIARLPDAARRILRTAAVLGRDVDVDVLLAMTGSDEDTLVEAVEVALVNGLVTEPAPGALRFAHALVRDTLYTDLSRLRRGRLHALAGAAIERLRPHEVASAAHHFAQAPGPHAAARAVYWGRLAAARARQRFAHRDGARLCRQVLEAYDRTARPDRRERLELVLELIRSAAYAGDLEGGRVLRGAAVAEASALGDLDLLARVLVSFDIPMVWTNHRYALHDREPIAAARRTLDELPPGDSELRCRLLIMLGYELEHLEREPGAGAAGLALAMARRIGDPELLAAALNAASMYVCGIGGLDAQLTERTAMGDELVALGGEHNLPGYRIVGHILRLQVACAYGHHARADREVAQAEQLADRYDLPLLAVLASWYHAQRLVVLGELAAAERAYERAAAELRHVGQWDNDRAMHYLALVCIRIDQGRTAELVDSAAEIAAVFEVAPAIEAHALALAAAGRPEQARAVAADPLPIAEDYLHDVSQTIRALLALAIGDDGRAASAYRALLAHEDELAGGKTAAVVLWPVAHVLGLLATHLGLGPEVAAAHHEHAITVAKRAGSVAWAARARTARAELPR